MKDPNCSYSRALAKIAIQGVKDGKSLIEISKLMDASPKAHRPKLLEAPVNDSGGWRAGARARPTRASRWWSFPISNAPSVPLAVKQVDIIMAAYPKDVKLIYKQFPLSMHPHAELAAEASLAAREQGKFWEMYDPVQEFPHAFAQQHPRHGQGNRPGRGISSRRISDSGKYKAVVDKDLADGEAAGVYGTPAFYHQRQAVQRRSDAGCAEADS
jgi:hypothetical protein